MHKYIIENFGRQMYKLLRNKTITVFSSTSIGNDPFFDSVGNGTGGVTDREGCRLYLFDVPKNNMATRANLITCTHELAHLALLHLLIGESRVALRHDDLGGNKAGTFLNYSTAEVHDRHNEGRLYLAKVWMRNGLKFSKYEYMALDFRDFNKF